MFSIYVDVLLNLPLKQPYTYKLPDLVNQDTFTPGSRVLVHFNHREETGIIEKLHSQSPQEEIFYINEVLDPEPIVTEYQINLAYWISSRYLCGPGEALFKMFPKVFPKVFVGKFPSKARGKDHFSEESSHLKEKRFQPEYSLNKRQKEIYQSIKRDFEENCRNNTKKKIVQKISQKNIHLLQGVTGSGKTEIYIYLLRDSLEEGRGAILLVPEISLTVQLIQRLRKVFGNRLALLHSGMSPKERFINYFSLRKEERKIVVGTRSAIFAPVQNLGLIILDEEHDDSFKEHSRPRYDARQIAQRRSKDHNCLLVYGSATPRIETSYHSRRRDGRIGFHFLPERAKGFGLPQVRLVSLPSPETIMSAHLLGELEVNLKKGEQSLLLLNTRGFFPYIYSRNNKKAESCPACSVSLRLHKDQFLRCHYCGYSYPFTGKGLDGGDVSLMGLGTQKLENFLIDRFPDARIERLDADAAAQRGVVQKTIEQFLRKEVDILLGTQMIARGLDAPNVSLVGVLQSEKGLHFPDFRAAEKTFSLLTQVAGRAGRSSLKGRVIFECIDTEHPIIQYAARQDYESFYLNELEERKASFYPPFSRIIRVLCRSHQEEKGQEFMQEFTSSLKKNFFKDANKEVKETKTFQLLGPSSAPIGKINHQFREHILIKTVDLIKTRSAVEECYNLHKGKLGKNLHLEIDLDPVDLL